jgi:hypothetical protein
MARTIKANSHTEITIRRPNGQIEVVRKDSVLNSKMDDAMFAKIKAATAQAGRGECIGYVNIQIDVEVPQEFDRLDAADRAYDQGRAAVYRAMDAKDDGEARDNTPAHKSDM